MLNSFCGVSLSWAGILSAMKANPTQTFVLEAGDDAEDVLGDHITQ
jgi:hypothetical protein